MTSPDDDRSVCDRSVCDLSGGGADPDAGGHGCRVRPPKRSSAELLRQTPTMPRPETLPHSETPLTDQERELLHDFLYR